MKTKRRRRRARSTELFFTTPDLDRQGIPRSSAHQAMAAGHLRAHKLGSRMIVFPENLRAFFAGLPPLAKREHEVAQREQEFEKKRQALASLKAVIADG